MHVRAARQAQGAKAQKWAVRVSYLATFVCATAFFGIAWKVAELWWVQLIWVTTGGALCVPTPELAKR